MKPDWDKLASEFQDSTSVLIADVDCTAGGKDLCETHGVKGYPTIKSFRAGDTEGEDYQGGRDFESLKSHAEGLGPSCTVNNKDVRASDLHAKTHFKEVLCLQMSLHSGLSAE